MYTAFADLLPKDHPYIRVHERYWKIFRGANVVMLSVEVTDGDISTFRCWKKSRSSPR